MRILIHMQSSRKSRQIRKLNKDLRLLDHSRMTDGALVSAQIAACNADALGEPGAPPIAPANKLPDDALRHMVFTAGRQRAFVPAAAIASIVCVALAAYVGHERRAEIQRRIGDLEAQAAETAHRAAMGAEAYSVVTNQVRGPLEQHLNAAAASVYLIALLGRDDGLSEIGTAWAAGERRLATNAHVAEAVQAALDSGERVIARKTAETSLDINVTGTIIHPGYSRWDPILSRTFAAKGATSLEPMQVTGICDVAILSVDDEVGRVLPLASADELAMLSAGDPVGYVGFPAENIIGSRLFGPPTLATGRILEISSPFFKFASANDALLIHHDIAMAGGASGSPMLNARGHVIALVNAGSAIPALSTNGDGMSLTRVMTGFNLAQRVDLLAELLDGSAEVNQDSRDPRWLAELYSITIAPDDAIEVAVDEIVRVLTEYEEIGPDIQPRKVWEARTAVPADQEASISYHVQLVHNTQYIFVALSTDWSDVALELTVDGTIVASNHEGGSMAAATYMPEEDEDIAMSISAPRGPALVGGQILLQAVALIE